MFRFKTVWKLQQLLFLLLLLGLLSVLVLLFVWLLLFRTICTKCYIIYTINMLLFCCYLLWVLLPLLLSYSQRDATTKGPRRRRTCAQILAVAMTQTMIANAMTSTPRG